MTQTTAPGLITHANFGNQPATTSEQQLAIKRNRIPITSNHVDDCFAVGKHIDAIMIGVLFVDHVKLRRSGCWLSE